MLLEQTLRNVEAALELSNWWRLEELEVSARNINMKGDSAEDAGVSKERVFGK